MKQSKWEKALQSVLAGKTSMKEHKLIKRTVRDVASKTGKDPKELTKELKALLSMSDSGYISTQGRIEKFTNKKPHKQQATTAPPPPNPQQQQTEKEQTKAPKASKKRSRPAENDSNNHEEPTPTEAAAPPAKKTKNNKGGGLVPGGNTETAKEQQHARIRKMLKEWQQEQEEEPTLPALPTDHTDIMRWSESRKRNDIKHGYFNKKEKATIRKAVELYATEKGFSTTDLTWLIGKRGERQKKSKDYGIWKTIAAVLPHRSIKAVAMASYRFLHPWAKKGRFTPEEDAALRQYAGVEGSRDWKAIGIKIQRPAEVCRDRYRMIKLGDKLRNSKTPWTKEEDERLGELVWSYITAKELAEKEEELAGIEKKMPDHRIVLDGVYWDAISEQLGTRDHIQCQTRWYNYLAPTMIQRGMWEKGDDKRLLLALWKLEPEFEWEVPWDDLIEKRTAQQCKRRWRLLRKMIRDASDKEFGECLSMLVRALMPELIDGHIKKEKLDAAEEESQEEESEEEEDDDDDNDDDDEEED